MKKYKEFDQQSGEWFRMKIGKIGGTAAKKMMGNTELDLVDELIAEMGSGIREETYMSAAMQRGVDLEPAVRNLFKKLHPEIEIEEVGLLVSSENEGHCCSPDGISKDDTIAIEIKCPSTKNHVKYIRMGGIMTDYKWQLVNYFFVNPKLQKLYCITFDDRFKPRPCQEFVITRDDVKEQLLEFAAKSEKFWKKLNDYKSKIF